MRPLSGDPVLRAQRSHSSSFGDNATPSLAMPNPNQMTFFMADEKTVEESGPSVRTSRSHRNLKQPDYGVESLATTISSLGHDSDDAEDEDVSRARQRWKKNMAPSLTRSVLEGSSISRSRSPKSSADISRDLSPLEFRPRRSSRTTLSAPLTPVFAGSSGPGSVLSSAHSRRDSDAASSMDDNASRAIIFSEEEEKELPSGPVDTGSAPQLVMPSLQMPSRRPFTDKGKNMGRLKVLIAGDSGVGKTSLVKAIVQTCEDIVHVDPISSTTVAIPEPSRRKSKSKSKNPSMQSTSQITEIYASTRPYPSWWSELDESRVLRRRKSMGDTVLERNLCFVDTPGYSAGTSCMECITPVVQYMESYFERVSSLTNISDGELINLMSGSGGSQVDVVFYVFLNRVKSVDIEYLKRLSTYTNMIPIISQTESLSPEQLLSLKTNILSELRRADIKPFLFDIHPDDALSSSRSCAPYAVSTITSTEQDTMDASLLMSPDYVQPLIPTELASLVSQIFEPSTISWLRHLTAKKFISWRSSISSSSSPHSPSPFSPSHSLTLRSSLSLVPGNSQALTGAGNWGGASLGGAGNSYALARINDHTQREERLAQIRLSKWAMDLQRSLQNERRRYDALANQERAVWLTERLGECVQDGTLVPVSQASPRGYTQSFDGTVGKGDRGTYSRKAMEEGGIDRTDPLGLLRLNMELRERGWVALQVVGSVGVLGGLAFLLARSWGTVDTAAEQGPWFARLCVDW